MIVQMPRKLFLAYTQMLLHLRGLNRGATLLLFDMFFPSVLSYLFLTLLSLSFCLSNKPVEAEGGPHRLYPAFTQAPAPPHDPIQGQSSRGWMDDVYTYSIS